jgi:hypothetical protein
VTEAAVRRRVAGARQGARDVQGLADRDLIADRQLIGGGEGARELVLATDRVVVGEGAHEAEGLQLAEAPPAGRGLVLELGEAAGGQARAVDRPRVGGVEGAGPDVVLDRERAGASDVPVLVAERGEAGGEALAQLGGAIVGQGGCVTLEGLELEDLLVGGRGGEVGGRRGDVVGQRGGGEGLLGDAVDLAAGVRARLARHEGPRERDASDERAEADAGDHPATSRLAIGVGHRAAQAGDSLGVDGRQREVVPRGAQAAGDLGLAEGGLEVVHVGVALVGRLARQRRTTGLERGGDLAIGAQLARRGRLVVELGEQDLLDDLAGERRAAGQQLVGDAADGVHVEAAVELSPSICSGAM